MWAGLWFFALLSATAVVRPLREAFGVEGGVDRLPWLFGATLVAMLVAQPLYAAWVSRRSRERFVATLHRGLAACLLGVAALLVWLPAGEQLWLGRAFYVWVSVFNLFAVATFWSVLADTFTVAEGTRLYGWIGVGGTAGAVAGAGAAAFLPSLAAALGLSFDQGLPALPVLSAALLEVGRRCERRLEAAARRRPGPPGAGARVGAPLGGGPLDGLREVARSPYLAGVCAYLLLGTLTATLLYFVQAGIVAATFADRAARLVAFGWLDVGAQGLTLLLQLFLTARVIGGWGIGPTLALLPLVGLTGFGGLLALPAFGVLCAAQVGRRATQHALSKPARELLFNALTRSEKYKAKAVIDTLVYRLGDLVGALLALALGASVAGATPALLLALALCAAWVGVALALGRAQARRAALAAGAPPGARRARAGPGCA